MKLGSDIASKKIEQTLLEFRSVLLRLCDIFFIYFFICLKFYTFKPFHMKSSTRIYSWTIFCLISKFCFKRNFVLILKYYTETKERMDGRTHARTNMKTVYPPQTKFVGV